MLTRKIDAPLSLSQESNLDRYAAFDRLANHRTILFLQGPNGPFFAKLAKHLIGLGCCVRKINFNAGDAFFFGGSNTMAYRSPLSDWPTFLSDYLAREGIEAIVLFGQWRPHHQEAIRIGKAHDIPVHVFEEGYIRPWWITFEEGGVNSSSSLRTMDIRVLPDQPPIARPRTHRLGFTKMAWYAFVYFLLGIVGAARYPSYRHHKALRMREALYWLRSAVRKGKYWITERSLRSRLLDAYGPDFFLVPLQVGSDSQLVHASEWKANSPFINHVVASFANGANTSDILVFKHHPMERGHANYASEIAAIAMEHGVASRVYYLHDGHVPSLLKRAKGAIVVNSTVGIQALYHGVPVCVCGDAFYDMPGITSKQNIDTFWLDPCPPERSTFRRFYRYMIRTTQINGSFYAGDLF